MSIRNLLLWATDKLSRRRRYLPQDLVLAKGEEWALFKYQNSRVLIIDGTRSLREWLNNLSANGWRQSSKQIANAIALEWDLMPPDIIVGFSRGGVLALMLAELWGVKKVICISTPKSAAKQLFLTAVPLYVEHEFDIVTQIPPTFVTPSPNVCLLLPGIGHGLVDIDKIPSYKTDLLDELLEWEI